jgi:LmbE family N-acetylglucosaminyl deacetylase
VAGKPLVLAHPSRTDLLISHRADDANTSHHFLGRMARTLARKNNFTLWELDQALPGGITDTSPNLFVDISPYIAIKREAVACYASQLKRYPGMDDAIEARDRLYGWQIGAEYAEGFGAVKTIVK